MRCFSKISRVVRQMEKGDQRSPQHNRIIGPRLAMEVRSVGRWSHVDEPELIQGGLLSFPLLETKK